MKLFKYLSEVLFPSTCISCGRAVNDDKTLFCASCLTHTNFTSFPSASQNEMMDRMVSIPQLKNAFAPLYFKKDAPIKDLFYKIKYGDRPDVAKKLAEFAVDKWIRCEKNELKIDAVCYVPIHRIKLSKRGYNQSEVIAREVSELLNIPLIHLLERNSNIETQTHFGRMDRLKNQEGTISVNYDTLRFSHILIVDDILTTGATIETCYDAIRKDNNDCALSVLTLAVTDSW
jgi:ComF family protein